MKKRNCLTLPRLMLPCVLAGMLCGCSGNKGAFYAEAGGGNERQESQAQGHSEMQADGAAKRDGESAREREASGQDGESPPEGCFVHICGAVESPGVYEMPPGSRLYEAIAAAGGFCEDACDYAVNQAQTVTDGMQIYIPFMDERMQGGAWPDSPGASGGSGSGTQLHDDTVNINTAGKEQLMTLPGIGAARAEAILAYRREHGAFGSTQELLKVSGIGQSVYEKIKDRIRI